jgi:hypothetical protein
VEICANDSLATAPPTWQTASDEGSCVIENRVMTECTVKNCIVVYHVNIRMKLKMSLRLRNGHEKAAGCGHSQYAEIFFFFFLRILSVLYFLEAILLVSSFQKRIACEVLNVYELK